MRILMVNPNVVVGGAQKIMLYLAKGLQERGHEVVIYTTAVDLSKLPPFTRDLRYHVEDVPILRPGGELANFTAIDNVGVLAARLLRLRRGIREAIRRYHIDLVNPHNPPANWLCSFLPVPVVWSCNNHPISFYENLRPGYAPLWSSKRGLHHRAAEAVYEGLDYPLMRYGMTRMVSPSEKIAREIRQVYHRDSEVIPFALADDDGIFVGEERVDGKFARIEEDGLTLLQVGQLTEDKKPRLALDVVERLQARIPRVRLQFVGDGTLRSELEAEVRQRKLEGVVSFLGFKDERELSTIYAAAHILLFPGAHQPCGIVPIEAIWKSVMPIVADTSGVTDILRRHGLTTIAPPTAEAFAAQVCDVYGRRTELEGQLVRLRQSLAQELSYERFLDRYEQCFETCLTPQKHRWVRLGHRVFRHCFQTPLSPEFLLIFPLYRRVRALLAQWCRGVVLDVGAGFSPFYEAANRYGSRYYSLDYPPSTELAFVDAVPPAGARHIWGDARRLPLQNQVCDTVICTSVLEHVTDPAAVLLELHRALRPGGRVIGSVPFCHNLHMEPFDYYRISHHGLRHLAEATGFRVVHLAPVGRGVHALGGCLADGLMRYVAGFRSNTVAQMRTGEFLARLVLLALLYPLIVAINLLAPLLDRVLPYPALPVHYVFVYEKPSAP